jgi:hypothetical protein
MRFIDNYVTGILNRSIPIAFPSAAEKIPKKNPKANLTNQNPKKMNRYLFLRPPHNPTTDI